MAIQPLTARSVLLSTLLGYHPPELPVSALVRVAGLFGIAEGATRAALSRLVATGEVAADNGTYRLTERLVLRQAQQDESAAPRSVPWTGRWEMAVVTTPARPQSARVALRRDMADLRLAELREGVWMRPDNLARAAEPAAAVQCTFFRCDYPDPRELSSRLWDLPGWAGPARQLLSELDDTGGLRDGFMLIAQVVRHLRLDPYLPPELLAPDWPGEQLRSRFTVFRDQFAQRLRDYSIGSGPTP
jgi:phenylacetic acid degradation operon negative regulatory protein